jgi:hypothetical protein
LERLQDERNSAVLSADQAQQEIKRQRDQANALLSQVEDLNGSLDQMRRERQAEVGRLRAELKQERIRWWHRWLRRYPPYRTTCRPDARRIGKGAAAMVAAVQQVMVGSASTLRREAAVHSNVQAMRFGIIW